MPYTFVSRGKLAGKPTEDLEHNPLPEGAIAKVYRDMSIVRNERSAHWANSLHCVREATKPISDVHSRMEMLNACHLAGVSARLGRGLKWDDKAGRGIGDDEADAMLSRPYRQGYETVMG